MPGSADANPTPHVGNRYRSLPLLIAIAALVFLIASCAEEETGQSDDEASDDRPTIEMASGDEDDDERENDGDADASSVPPLYRVHAIADKHPAGTISMIVYGQEPVAHMDALMQGELALSNGCLGVANPEDGEFTSVVWPFGYSIDADGEKALLLDETGDVVASEGERIALGGGNSPDPEGKIAQTAPEDCVAERYWMAGGDVRLASNPGPDQTPAPESTPKVQTEEEALQQDAEQYAEDRGISIAEAKRRLRLQQLPGPLQQALMENEADRFGGLYIEHEPEFRVVVQMTDGDEEAVRAYIDDPELDEIVDVETVEASYRELQEAQQEAMDIIQELDVMAGGGVNVQENRVEINVAKTSILENALDEAGKELPEHVVIVEEKGQPETLESN